MRRNQTEVDSLKTEIRAMSIASATGMPHVVRFFPPTPRLASHCARLVRLRAAVCPSREESHKQKPKRAHNRVCWPVVRRCG